MVLAFLVFVIIVTANELHQIFGQTVIFIFTSLAITDMLRQLCCYFKCGFQHCNNIPLLFIHLTCIFFLFEWSILQLSYGQIYNYIFEVIFVSRWRKQSLCSYALSTSCAMKFCELFAANVNFDISQFINLHSQFLLTFCVWGEFRRHFLLFRNTHSVRFY